MKRKLIFIVLFLAGCSGLIGAIDSQIQKSAKDAYIESGADSIHITQVGTATNPVTTPATVITYSSAVINQADGSLTPVIAIPTQTGCGGRDRYIDPATLDNYNSDFWFQPYTTVTYESTNFDCHDSTVHPRCHCLYDTQSPPKCVLPTLSGTTWEVSVTCEMVPNA